MAKSRAQRKAERRAREAEAQARAQAGESQAQRDTQVPRSGDVDEIEAIEAGIGAGADEKDLQTADTPQGSLPSREVKRQQKQAEKERRANQKRQEEQLLSKRHKEATATRKRSGVFAFLASSAAELRRVQWPDRDTLIQASAVTLVFCLIFAVYLGLLDLFFNWFVQRVI